MAIAQQRGLLFCLQIIPRSGNGEKTVLRTCITKSFVLLCAISKFPLNHGLASGSSWEQKED